MIEYLKQAYRKALSVDNETPRISAFVRRATAGVERPVVLDVGCGYGRTLRALNATGIEALGIDVNPEIVAHNVRDGLDSCTPEEFRARGMTADVIVMSHVVEHFEPRRLLGFMDDYLGYLRPGGHLVVVTPLASNRFFDDFDHVKPYQPLGIAMVYGVGDAQVQYRGKHRLELVDLFFRRSPFAVAFARGLYVRSWTSRWLQLANLAGALTFRASGGLIGRTTGWAGLYRKV